MCFCGPKIWSDIGVFYFISGGDNKVKRAIQILTYFNVVVIVFVLIFDRKTYFYSATRQLRWISMRSLKRAIKNYSKN